MITPTDVEQLHLEFINRARSDPDGELDFLIANPATGTGVQSNITSALSFFGVDMDLLYDQLDGVPSVPPLAWNTALAQSADAHSQAMIDADIQSHQVPGELGLGARITAAGYTGWQQVAENVFAYAQDPLHAHAAFYIDWGYGPGGIQSPAGHRLTMLNGLYREIGIGELAVPASNDIGPNSHTQHFGIRPGTDAFLTGVVIEDGDGDQFYDIGEGLSGVSVTATGSAGTFSTTTWGSGGYSLELPPGSYTVTFSGGELESTVERAVTMADVNVKIDAIAPAATDDGGGDGGGDDGGGGDGDQRIVGGPGDETSRGAGGNDTIIDRSGSNRIEGLAGDDRLISGNGADTILGGSGDDVIKSGGGADTVEGGADDDVILSGDGHDIVRGGSGEDVIKAGDGDDEVDGGAGPDQVFGWRGMDTIIGGPGDDVLRGNFDDDILQGGPGDDRLQGGPGRDVFVFVDGLDEDRVLDWNTALEKLDFRQHSQVDGIEDLTISQVGTSVLILTPDGGRVVLAQNDIETVSASDFLF